MSSYVFDSKKAEIVEAGIDIILPDLAQPRQSYDVESIDGLAHSLENGMINKPLLERMTKDRAREYMSSWEDSPARDILLQQLEDASGEEVYIIVAGHRRYVAALRAGYPTISCFVVNKDPDEGLSIFDRRLLQIHENTYTPLTKYMEAYATVDLYNIAITIKGKYSLDDLAEDLKVSRSTVDQRFRFVKDTHLDIVKGVESGRITWTQAVNVGRIENKNAQRSALAHIINENLDEKAAYSYVSGILATGGEGSFENLIKPLSDRVESGEIDRGLALVVSLLPQDDQEKHIGIMLSRDMSVREARTYVKELLRSASYTFRAQSQREGDVLKGSISGLADALTTGNNYLHKLLALALLGYESNTFADYRDLIDSDTERMLRDFYEDFSRIYVPRNPPSFEGPYACFRDFSEQITLLKGERRRRLIGRMKKQTSFSRLLQESIELNKKNRKEKRPTLYDDVVVHVKLEDIVLDSKNPRSDLNPDNLEKNIERVDIIELADSIRTEGLLNPINLMLRSDGRYDLDAGNRRFTAIYRLYKLGELPEEFYSGKGKTGEVVIPAFILNDASEDLRLSMKIAENSQQRPPPAEEADTVVDMFKLMREKDSGATIEDAAKRVGKSVDFAKRALVWEEKVHEEVKMLVHKGLLTYTNALVLSSIEKEDQVEVAIDAVIGSYTKGEMVQRVSSERQGGQQMLFDIRDFRGDLKRMLNEHVQNTIRGIAQRIININPEKLQYYLSSRNLMVSFYNFNEEMDSFLRFIESERV